MTNALSVYENFDGLQKAASALYKSGYFKDAKSEAQAMVKVMAGAEIGIQPFASMAGINIIEGKPAFSANLIATLVDNHPDYAYHVLQADNEACVIEWFQNGKKVGESSFTMAEARKIKQWSGKKKAFMPLTDKFNWQNWPSEMLFARNITRGQKRFAAGVSSGAPIYTPEELGADTDEDGHIIDVTPVAPPTANEKIIDELYPQDADKDPVEKAIKKADPDHVTKTIEDEDDIMTVDRACAMTNAGGVRYDDLTSTELSHRSGGINTGLRKPDLTPEKRKEYEDKLQAIKVILQARNDGSIT